MQLEDCVDNSKWLLLRFYREIKMVQPCTYVLIFSLVKTSKVLSVVLILTQLCTLWRRNKLLIRPQKQSPNHIGLRPPLGLFPMIDELKQAFFFFGGSSYDNLWFPVSFPNLLLQKHIEKLSFLILEYTIVFSPSHDSKSSCDILSCILILFS